MRANIPQSGARRLRKWSFRHALVRQPPQEIQGEEENGDRKAAVAGTLESSDCMVTVEDGDGNIDLVLESTVIHQYGNQIRHVVLDTLESLGVQNVKIKIVDKGALDCTIRARVEAAVYRSAGQSEQLPWGGAIR